MPTLNAARGRALLFALALLIALTASTKAPAFLDGPDPLHDRNGSSRLVLRLADLPPGFVVDDERCGPIEIEDAPAVVTDFIRANRPEGCLFPYARVFGSPHSGPPTSSVASAAMIAPSVGIAEAGAALVPDLMELFSADADGGTHTEVPAPHTFGEVTRLFHATGVPNEAGDRRYSVLFWRDGRVLAALIVAGPTFAATDARAVQLAARQQARIESPSPYRDSERNDLLVSLDDPRLRVPVYWLGERFAPGRGLPAAYPDFAFPGLGGAEDPTPGANDDPKLVLGYTQRIVLGTWTRSAWSRFRRVPSARREWTWDCTRSHEVKLARGRAVVYAAYAQDYRRCPNRPPRHYFAHVFVDRVVIGINQSPCNDARGCEPFYSPAYNSFRGMATVARGLELRPRRTG